ncbi:MAG TPA: ROK family transcriptional regulator [Nocardioidaceae bacterium]|nr:ROK family transcriptional regulator [Nocardioidaceae bacterium]
MTEPGQGSLERLRLTNRTTVLDLLARSGPLSRADVTRATGLSRTTVSNLVRELLHEELVAESADRGQPHKGGSGRPPTLLSLRGLPGAVVGVDIGHRHVRVVVAELSATVLAEQSVVLDVDHAAKVVLDKAAEMIRATLAECDVPIDRVVGFGMGVPGPVDPRTGMITSAILPGWIGLAPADELSARIGVPVRIDNDANIGALGELTFGAAQGLADVIYVKAAGGLGAGLVLGGQLHRGATGIAGEIGHVRLNEAGPVCRCGNRGCLETQVSAPKLVEVLQPAHDEELTVERMLELDRSGDAGVNRVLDDAGRSIGRVLADLSNHINPAAIVVGGAMGQSTALLNGIRDSVDRYAQPDIAATIRITAGALGERAEVMGALALARDVTAVTSG